MKYLLKTVETYRVQTENEAKALIEEAKKQNCFALSKYMTEYKEQKAKGEVIDSWYRVTLTKLFTDEKDPEYTTDIKYDVSGFPIVEGDDNEF